VQIKPKEYKYFGTAPPSKSESLRALIIAMLLKSKVLIKNLSFSIDALTAIKILSSSGAKVHISQNDVEIDSTNFSFPNNLNCGESAFLFRTIVACSVLMSGNNYLIGTNTLKKRMFEDIDNFLKINNITFVSNNSFLPFEIQSKSNDEIIEIDASQSSQLLSGLLIANAFIEHPKTIICNSLVSIGYVDLTLCFLEKIGVIYRKNEIKYLLHNKNIKKDDVVFDISGDWSGAAFLLVAAAISGKASIDGLEISSKQPDRAIIDVLNECGAKINILDNSIKIEQCELHSFNFDATNCPDLFPPLVSLAVNCNGESVITGTTRLLNKESNRLKTLVDEFIRIGANIRSFDNKIVVNGKRLKGGLASYQDDHRIAMALSVAALNSKNGIEIENSSVVNKSFPNFFECGFL